MMNTNLGQQLGDALSPFAHSNNVGGALDQANCGIDMDTFPAKTYSLICFLSESVPTVAAFSDDGASFEVYDQTTISQQYLSRYFKHNNWGSFVRQLNLYGFTSSRRKENSEVVVWSHELFHRDHIEWLPNIKRTKKTKKSSAAPGQAGQFVRPSSSSPPSVCGLSNEVVTTFTAADREWLQSQFAIVKQQNTHIEEQNKQLKEQLDFLIRHTVRVDEGYSGSKRRRAAPQYNFSEGAPVPLNKPTHNRAQSDDADDSFKGFIDVMLANTNEESKAIVGDDYFEGGESYTKGHSRRDSNSAIASIINSLGSESGNVMFSHSHGQQAEQFMPSDANPNPQNIPPHSRTEWVPGTNHLEDKMTGPHLVYSAQDAPPITSSSSVIDPDEENEVPQWVAVVPPARAVSPDDPYPSNDDEEHGNPYTDMTLVSAHLVEESERGITLNNSAAQLIENQQRHTRQLSKRVMCAVVVLVLAAIVSLTSTIILTRQGAAEKYFDDSDDVTEHEKYEFEEKRPPKNLHSGAVSGEVGAKETLVASAPNSALSGRPQDSSYDFPLGQGTRRWKDWGMKPWERSRDFSGDPDFVNQHSMHHSWSSGDNLFDRDLPEAMEQNATGQTSAQDNITAIAKNSLHFGESNGEFTEMSLMINGDVETFHCYHQ